MPSPSSKVDGLDLVGGRLDAVEAAVAKAAARATWVAAEYLLGEAVKVVPIAEGDLARSGQVRADARELVAYVIFDRPYAIAQHEDATFTHAPGRHFKYLERTALEQRDQIKRVFEAAFRKALGT